MAHPPAECSPTRAEKGDLSPMRATIRLCLGPRLSSWPQPRGSQGHVCLVLDHDHLGHRASGGWEEGGLAEPDFWEKVFHSGGAAMLKRMGQTLQ